MGRSQNTLAIATVQTRDKVTELLVHMFSLWEDNIIWPQPCRRVIPDVPVHVLERVSISHDNGVRPDDENSPLSQRTGNTLGAQAAIIGKDV